jgi:hypothetical protein
MCPTAPFLERHRRQEAISPEIVVSLHEYFGYGGNMNMPKCIIFEGGTASLLRAARLDVR